MKKTCLSVLALVAALGALASPPAGALPKMEINAAKGTLYNRQPTPKSREFNSRRVRDLPSFDRLGIGNYYAEYRLDGGKKLQVWMYVESAPPTVDEVVLFVSPATPKDLTPARALQLIQLVYGESRQGAQVVTDFQAAPATKLLNPYKLNARTFEHQSLLPLSFDGSLYYLGNNFGYKVSYHKGGIEVGIHRKDLWQNMILDVKRRHNIPDNRPAPKPPPKPAPTPTPHPRISW